MRSTDSGSLRRPPFPVTAAFAAAAAAFVLAPAAGAQEFTAADSGWVRIFNGNNFDGLYSRTYGATAQPVRPPALPYILEYPGTDTATIRVSTTTSAQQGNIGTDKTSYRHYRVRVEYRFDVQNSNNNAGLTYHTDETAPRMQNNWPRSIESQMKQNETGSAFSIQQMAFTTRTTGTGAGSNYSPTGANIVQACEFGCNGRWYRGNPLLGTHPAWNQMEVVVRGSDSALHNINGTTVMRLWNIRLVNSSGQLIAPVDSGGITLQAEGALIRYRRWEIMEFPATTPMSAHHLHRLFLDTPTVNSSIPPGSSQRIRWRHIGAFPTVKIEYRYTSPSGNWVTIADSAPNTGSYEWTAPNEPHGLPKAASLVYAMRIRISGPDYVWADSVNTQMAWATGIHPGRFQGALSFSVPGRGEALSGLAPGTRVEIHDASGRRVRALALGEESLAWDGTDAMGRKVPAGLYFLGASMEGTLYRTGRILLH